MKPCRTKSLSSSKTKRDFLSYELNKLSISFIDNFFIYKNSQVYISHDKKKGARKLSLNLNFFRNVITLQVTLEKSFCEIMGEISLVTDIFFLQNPIKPKLYMKHTFSNCSHLYHSEYCEGQEVDISLSNRIQDL